MSRIQLDLRQPEFLPSEIHAIKQLIDKHEAYEAQGRDLEARGVARAIWIVYTCFKGDFEDTKPTNWSEI